MKKLRVAACMLMLALAGCDNNDNAPTAVKNDETPAALKRLQTKAKLSVPDRQKLAQQSEGKELTLLDASEVQRRRGDAGADVPPSRSTLIKIFARTVHVVDKKRQSGWCTGAVR